MDGPLGNYLLLLPADVLAGDDGLSYELSLLSSFLSGVSFLLNFLLTLDMNLFRRWHRELSSGKVRVLEHPDEGELVLLSEIGIC